MSSETPKPSPAKTKSARKPLLIAGVALIIVGVATGCAFFVLQPGNGDSSDTLTVNPGTSSAKTYTLETATTPAEQERGLSGRSGLPADGGMQFDFGGLGERCIWMKDMKFAIDVIWLDERNRIVSMVPNMSPDSYPKSYCAQASTVVELPAGTIKQQGLRPGQVVEL